MAEEDNIEMKDLEKFKEVEREIAAEEETNIYDDDDELLERNKTPAQALNPPASIKSII